MRYRKLDANDDYVFGGGQVDFHKDTPEGVGQAVKTRLRQPQQDSSPSASRE